MQEITRIHLAGTPYNIELAAKKSLEAYVDAIRQSLHADEDAMREIESRMSEILADRGVHTDGVIKAGDIDALQEQLGEPADFADDEETEAVPAAPSTTRSGKRLMRDPQNAMLGGVCSGLAAYLGVDTVWVRIAFGILLLITSGVMIPIYILMWIVMPEAKTAADRLRMSGAPVTLASLKAESDDAELKPAEEPILVRIIRYIFGAGFSAGAVLAMLATATVLTFTFTHRSDYFIKQNIDWLPVPLGLMALGGLLLSVLLGLTAYVCFVRDASRKIQIALFVAMVLGLSAFTTGALLTADKAEQFQARMEQSTTISALDAPALDGSVKKIQLAAHGADFTYEVTTDKPKVTARYNTETTSKPALTFRRSGDTLIIEGDVTSGNRCSYRSFFPCFGTTDITLYGPALDEITTTASALTYRMASQPQLVVTSTGNSALRLASSGTIDQLNANFRADAALDTSDAKITKADLRVDGRVAATFGALQSLSITAPLCTQDLAYSDIAAINAPQTDDITLNGQKWAAGQEHRCVVINDTWTTNPN